MISRVWYAWTSPAKADAYEAFLLKEIFPVLRDGRHKGLKGTDLLRRDQGEEVEFVTIIWFDSWALLRAFAGDSDIAVVAEEDKRLVTRYDERVRHYEVPGHDRVG